MKYVSAIAAALVLALTTSAAPVASAAGDDSDAPAAAGGDEVRIGAVEKVIFADYNKSTGDLQWELRAGSAESARGGQTLLGTETDWKLSDVKILFYGRDAASPATSTSAASVPALPRVTVSVITPECLYFDRRGNRRAESAGELFMEGAAPDAFTLTGSGWDWNDTRNDCRVTVTKNVCFRLAKTARRGEVRITSERLEVTLQKTASAPHHVFHFTGGVQLLLAGQKPEENVEMGAVQLVVRVKNTSAGLSTENRLNALSAGAPRKVERAAGGSNEGAGKRQAATLAVLENIVANGSVEIKSRGYTMTGHQCDFVIHGEKQTFTVTGSAGGAGGGKGGGAGEVRARVTDPARGLVVTGDRIKHVANSNQIEVKRNVRLELPSFVSRLGDDGKLRKLTAKQILALPPAVVTGDYLLADISQPQTSRVEMRSNVRVADTRFHLSAESVLIESPRDPAKDRSLDALSGDADKLLDRVRLVRAIGNVNANYDDARLECASAEIFPKRERFVLKGDAERPPLLAKAGAKLRGAHIELDQAAGAADVSSSLTQRAEVTLPPVRELPATPPAASPATSPSPATLPTVITCDTLSMRENKTAGTTRFNFDGGVRFAGALNGRCDKLEVLADSKDAVPAKTKAKPLPAKAPKPPAPPPTPLARIIEMVATGSVLLNVGDYTAEGGRAEIHPRVALVEKWSVQGKLDGAAPQFLVIKKHESTPGKRPRLTVQTTRPPALAGEAPAAASPAATVPVNIDSDEVEIVRGDERSRFFLKNDVRITSQALGLDGRCDNAEGFIVQTSAGGAKPSAGSAKPVAGSAKPVAGKPRSPEYDVAHIIGRGNVSLHLTGKENASATCGRLDLYPAKHELHLTESPRLTRAGLAESNASTYVFNWQTNQWDARAGTTPQGTVNRPTINFDLRTFGK